VRDNQRLMPGEGVIDLTGFPRSKESPGYEDGISPQAAQPHPPHDMPTSQAARLGLETTLGAMRRPTSLEFHHPRAHVPVIGPGQSYCWAGRGLGHVCFDQGAAA
jgi:hypothetical protein